MKRESVTIDRMVRESARAKIRVMVRRILCKHGYDRDESNQEQQMGDVIMDQKEAVREVARGYLAELHPKHLPEFDTVFDSLYGVLEKREREASAQGDPPKQGEEARSFEASGSEIAVVGMACYIAYALLKATMKDIAKRDLPRVLDRLEARLSQSTGRPELVSAVLRRVEGILQSM